MKLPTIPGLTSHPSGRHSRIPDPGGNPWRPPRALADEHARHAAAEALYTIARSNETMGEFCEARFCYESVLLIEPGNAKARCALEALDRVQWFPACSR